MPFLRLIRDLLCPRAKTATENHTPRPSELIKQRGWRQWSCLRNEDVPSALKGTPLEASRSAIADDARLLVVSQSCDLVHPSYDAEPVAECYVCEPLVQHAEPDGNLTAGKSPRELHVLFTLDGKERWHRIRSNGRVLAPRHRLAGIDPDPSILVTDSAIRILQRWVINRAVRTAFPDAFNNRTRKALVKLESRLKRGGVHLLGLYVNLSSWYELPDNQIYEIDFVGLVHERLEWEQRKAIGKMLGEIASAYDQAEGITVGDYRVQDEEEAPMSLQRTHRLFPLDYLSLRDKPGGDLPSPS